MIGFFQRELLVAIKVDGPLLLWCWILQLSREDRCLSFRKKMQTSQAFPKRKKRKVLLSRYGKKRCMLFLQASRLLSGNIQSILTFWIWYGSCTFHKSAKESCTFEIWLFDLLIAHWVVNKSHLHTADACTSKARQIIVCVLHCRYGTSIWGDQGTTMRRLKLNLVRTMGALWLRVIVTCLRKFLRGQRKIWMIFMTQDTVRLPKISCQLISVSYHRKM